MSGMGRPVLDVGPVGEVVGRARYAKEETILTTIQDTAPGLAEHFEPMRNEMNREVGGRVADAMGKTVKFERPDVNTPLLLKGRRVVPDLRWPRCRLTLEIDSTAWHTDPLARADDRERQALLEAHGETVLRVHWLDAVLSPSKLVEMLRSTGAPPARG